MDFLKGDGKIKDFERGKTEMESGLFEPLILSGE
jgi:hypothetical protein